MGKYKQVQENITVGEALDTTDIEAVRDEMQEWQQNMEGTGLENTLKYESVSEAADQLDNVDSILFDNLWEAVEECEELNRDDLENLSFSVAQFRVRSRRQSESRSIRVSNAVALLNGALDCLEGHINALSLPEEKTVSVIQEIEDLRSYISELEGIDFPGMYG